MKDDAPKVTAEDIERLVCVLRRRDQYRALPYREFPADFSGEPDPYLRPSREQLSLL